MKTIEELVEFRRDLFFDGAVQLGWFENDSDRRDKASSNFVFHGPHYHGVSEEDIDDSKGYRLTDTLSFSQSIIQSLYSQDSKEYPITLAIAGYGTGKSHLGLTLSTLLSDPTCQVAKQIFSNMKEADQLIGADIERLISSYNLPVLVIPINGMGNFDLASELSRQALIRLNSYGLDTSPIEDLWPRFQQAITFVERNFDFRQSDFDEKFEKGISEDEIIARLSAHDDYAFQRVNEIFEIANGYPIRAVGQESPQQLIHTLCDSYCGEGKAFQNILILFDEFGRYLEFAAERPHIAGDAALQQIFEGIQDNADKCSLLCLNQYELKVYLARINRDRQSTIQRYITRYDSARKFYLSSNLETLFAHLIKKKNSQFLTAYLADHRNQQGLHDIQKWFPTAANQSVWRNQDLYRHVIVEGCWPLHPLAILFLSKSADFLQQRSAISFVADAIEKEKSRSIGVDESPWTISAAKLCDSPLLKELIVSEEYGQGGAIAQSFETVNEKYKHDFTDADRHTLLAIVIASKLGLKSGEQSDTHQVLSALSGLKLNDIEKSIQGLISEYGVLEWNDRFSRYEIIADAVPRSAFLSFLRKKTQGITIEQTEEIFASYLKGWAELNDIDPEFPEKIKISTSEWMFLTSCTHLGRLTQSINNAIEDWQKAIKPDNFRGQAIYCYVRADEELSIISKQVQNLLDKRIEEVLDDADVPILIILLYDEESKLRRVLSEISILSGSISAEEKQKFSHFIENHEKQAKDELKLLVEEMLKQREYVASSFYTIEKIRLKKVALDIFNQTYPQIIPFPFDGFATVRGNAAKDCRLITSELIKCSLNLEWISTQEPQAQNRARQLFKTWDAIGEDGEIRFIPKQDGLRKIITAIGQQLETEKMLNVGDLLYDLIAPPVGLNIASAGLVFGVFFAARHDIAVLVLHDQDISPGNWVSKAFSGNFLDLNVLSNTTIRYVSGSEANEWQKLLSNWDLEQTHIGKISFLTEAQKLRGRISLPPGELFERYSRLEAQTQNSTEAINSLNDFLENQETYFERAVKKNDSGNLSRIASAVSKRLKNMRENSELWVEDQYAPAERLYVHSRQAVIQFFDDWLSQQSCLSSKNVADFRRYMIDIVGNNLKNIELNELLRKVEKYAVKIITGIEEREKIFFIVEDSEAFLDSHRIHSECRVAELREWINDAKGLIEPLIKAGKQVNAPEVKKILTKIDEFVDSCKKQIKQHEKRVSALWNLSFKTVDEIRQAQREVDVLLSIFSGDNPTNIEDLSTMRNQLNQFESNITLWTNMSIANEELSASVAKTIDYEIKNQGEEDEPVWDTQETYENILKFLMNERKKAAAKWISELSLDKDKIQKMDARSCQSAFGRLDNLPVYIDSEQVKFVDELKNAIKTRLNDLKLDGVLEMFYNLSSSLQNKFIEIVTKK
jgi:hypothetical protein